LSYRIRPSARLISTIGKDLVKDKFAAVAELVKNSYDADATYSYVCIEFDKDTRILTISVEDDGHGMDLDTVVNIWLVPATSDKLNRKTSPKKKRPLQGRKGIGRFAAAVLGTEIHLKTKADKNKQVVLTLDLKDFSGEKLLDDVSIDIQESEEGGSKGTFIGVTDYDVTEKDVEEIWSAKQRSKLQLELRKLLAPTEVINTGKKLGYSVQSDKFDITLEYSGIPNIADKIVEISPFNIVDMYDYRIYGEISKNGTAEIRYLNQNVPSIKEEKLTTKILLESQGDQEFPGALSFDFRVFDRDPESIDALIGRGLIDPESGDKVGKRKARDILNENYGVSLFRGLFRIRPYGDSDVDWLELDKDRVQNPSRKVGHNQVIGFVNIESEENSNLIEKSARDGLVDNKHYYGLIHSLKMIMIQLEARRFEFRQKSFRGRKGKSIDKSIEDLFDYTGVSRKIKRKLTGLEIGHKQQVLLLESIEKEFNDEQKRKSDEYKRIKETIALYQGQATLGKITHVLLHEGRKHIKVINETPPRLLRWMELLLKKFDQDLQDKLYDRADLLVKSSKSLALLFKRIEPLAVTRRPNRKNILLNKEVIDNFEIFSSDLKRNSIETEIDIDDDLLIYSTSFDLTTVFANLIENSLFWLSLSDKKHKKITVEAGYFEGDLEITFSDTGPGFQGPNLESMFEPGFSMRPEGTGLGLALVGEAVDRMNGEIRAAETTEGACFIITIGRG